MDVLTLASGKPTQKTEPMNTSSAPPALVSNPALYPKPEGGFVELDGLKVALARPTYGNMMTASENSLLSAVMTASNHGLKWSGNLSPDKLGWGHARNTATKGLVTSSPDTDGLLWVDSDIVMPTWAIWKLMSGVASGLDFVSGVYFNRGNPFAPVIYERRTSINGIVGKTGYGNVQSFPRNTMWNIDGCGFGFCYTSKKMIDAIYNHPDFEEKFGWFPDTRFEEGGAGEDFNFCLKAKQAGFDIWADTSILLGHEGQPYVWSILDHIKEHDGPGVK